MNFILGCIMLAVCISLGYLFLHLALMLIVGIISAVVFLFSWVIEKIRGK